MSFINRREDTVLMYTYENINWSFEYTIFKVEPHINGLNYPIDTKKPNEAKFVVSKGYKSIYDLHKQSIEDKLQFVHKLYSILSEIESQGYKVYNFDLESVVYDEKGDPCIMLFYPVYSIKDSKEIVNNLDGFIKVDPNKATNSFILAEIFGEILFPKEYKKISDKKMKTKFFKEKMCEVPYSKYLRDFYNWHKKAVSNKYSLTDSYEEFKKAYKKMKERNEKKTQKLSLIKRTGRTSEGIGKLKESDETKSEEEVNQDAFYMDVDQKEKIAITVVMDGVSTASIGNGNMASNILKETVVKLWDNLKKGDINDSTVEKFVRKIIYEASGKIIEYANEHKTENTKANDIMASTIAGVIINGSKAYIFSAGDSKIYIKGKDYFFPLNPEHNKQTEELLKGKEVQNESSPITECVGKALLKNNNFVFNPVKCYISAFDILADEDIIVCSDGVFDFWKGFDWSEKEDNFFSDYTKMEEQFKQVKKISSRILSTLDQNMVGDNITITILRPVFETEQRSNVD